MVSFSGIHEYNLALLRAADSGAIHVARILLESGADVNAAAANGDTPLKVALQRGNRPMVRLFVSKGAKVENLTGNADSLLHFAISRNSPAAIIVAGAYSRLINSRGAEGYTPLHIAAAKGFAPLVKKLIKMGANLDEASDAGTTALEVAEMNDQGHVAAIIRRASRKLSSSTSTKRE